MNVDFSNAMRVVAKLTRAQKLVEATRIIQAALSAKQTQIESREDEELHEPKIERGARLKKSLAEVVDTLRRAKRETPSHKSKKPSKSHRALNSSLVHLLARPEPEPIGSMFQAVTLAGDLCLSCSTAANRTLSILQLEPA